MARKLLLALVVGVLALITAATASAGGPPPGSGFPKDLEELHGRLLPVFEIPGVVYTDADEATGRLKVAVENRGLAKQVEARARAAGVPAELVDVVESAPIVPMTTLRDTVRPLEGGLQINFTTYLCTLGFNAVRDSTEGFVVNSHCTSKQGGVESTKYYQPSSTVVNSFIGTEIADPKYFKGGACPRGKVCRYSDSAFASRAAGVTASMGYIAQTGGANNGSLTIAGQFHITSEAAGNAGVGTLVNKVGRTTGWTQGAVTNKCVNTAVSGSNIVQLCQDFVSAGVGAGDSGSPVFSITSGNDVLLRGILWGGSTDGSMFVYSPISNIERELGALATY